MSIFAFGGEMGFFIPSDANAIESSSPLGGAGASYNSSFARCYMGVTGGSAYAETPEIAQQTDYWHHFEIDQGSSLSSDTTLKDVVTLHDSPGNQRIRLRSSWTSGGAAGTWQLEYWTGAAWAAAGSFSAATNARQTLDMHIYGCGTAGGGLDLYVSSTKRVGTGIIDLMNVAGIAKARHWGRTVGINEKQAHSQIIMANESTIGMRVGTIYMSGAGATDQWNGSHTDVDEIAYSDADFASTISADQVDLYSGTSVPSFAGYTIRAIGIGARVKKGSSGPTQCQLAIRAGGTTYFSGNKPLDLAYGAITHVWEANPNTLADWQSSEISALQYGIKSIA